ncbi:MAG TPA: DNA-processing protein DprA, partial [Clostridiaceae bacterium]|nr:DNA-processing protein DprA [Clostridiaceae bacterium]
MSESLEYWVWISSMVKINPRQKYELVQYFEDPYNLWRVRKEELEKIPIINDIIVEQLMDKKIRSGIDNLMKIINKEKIKVVTINDTCYPECLKNIYDPPVVIYVKGNVEKDENALAVVGSRKATQYGMDTAWAISHKLSKYGITIISGMALGIDSHAHKGTLEAGGRTIAVLGCGLDIVYPKENKKLMERIIEQGAVVSEFVPGTVPMPFNFPSRNRLISGMSKG